MVASRGTPRISYGSKESRFGWRVEEEDDDDGDDDALLVLVLAPPPWPFPPPLALLFVCRSEGVRYFDLCPEDDDDEAGGLRPAAADAAVDEADSCLGIIGRKEILSLSGVHGQHEHYYLRIEGR